MLAAFAGLFLVLALSTVIMDSPTGYFIQDFNETYYEKFDGDTTNLSAVENISCVDNAVLEIQDHGKIEFIDDCIDFNGSDLDSYVTIEENYLGIDIANVPNLNREIMGSIYNLELTDPAIGKDGSLCQDCAMTDYTAGTLTFIAQPDISFYQAYEICNENQVCQPSLGENWSNCRADCICNDDGTCEQESGENNSNCPGDCPCNYDGICEEGETPENCRQDCICNYDDACEPEFGENRSNCEQDCYSCNLDGICEPEFRENRTSCPDDCAVCDNNGICNSVQGETRVNCYEDCAVCDNNSVCETNYNENPENCPTDCVADVTPPRITDIQVENTTYNSTKIAFFVDELSYCEIRYGKESGIYPYSIASHDCLENTSATLQSLSDDTLYHFIIVCNDSSDNRGNSIERLFRTSEEPLDARRPTYTTFDGETTDFDTLFDLENVYDAVLEKTAYGKIEFLEDYLNFTNANLDRYVYIGENLIYIDTTMLPDLNVSSRLYLYNITFDDPGILMDEKPCPIEQCDDISYEDDILSFNVRGFGSYEAREKINMSVWDSTDDEAAKVNQTVVFYATFRYLDKLVIHDGVNCSISFPDSDNTTEYEMDFDHYKKHYKYSERFEEDGEYTYRVVCDGEPIGEDDETRESTFLINTTAECGDGICHEYLQENCSNCKADCGECPKKNCTAEWICTEWSDCVEGVKTRTCVVGNECLIIPEKPSETMECAEPCNNSRLDPGEEGIDCGGVCPDPCPATCDDDKRNQNETGIDCGGPCDPCATCSDGEKNCVKMPDGRTICEEGVDCGGNCGPCPGCDNGLQDPGEEGVDCGGVCPDPCEKPPEKEEPSGGMSWTLIIIILVVVGVVGGGVSLYFLKPELYKEALSSIQGKSHKEEKTHIQETPSQTLENYIMQNLRMGYKPVQLRSNLIASGWDKARVDQAMEGIMYQFWGQKIDQLVPVVMRMNLRRPDKVYSALVKKKYPPYVAKMAIQKALQMRKGR